MRPLPTAVFAVLAVLGGAPASRSREAAEVDPSHLSPDGRFPFEAFSAEEVDAGRRPAFGIVDGACRCVRVDERADDPRPAPEGAAPVDLAPDEETVLPAYLLRTRDAGASWYQQYEMAAWWKSPRELVLRLSGNFRDPGPDDHALTILTWDPEGRPLRAGKAEPQGPWTGE